jgi:hypothetical protein
VTPFLITRQELAAARSASYWRKANASGLALMLTTSRYSPHLAEERWSPQTQSIYVTAHGLRHGRPSSVNGTFTTLRERISTWVIVDILVVF